MARFKDSGGRWWDVSIDVIQLRKVRERTKTPFANFEQINELTSDPVRLVDVLYLLCEEQAKKFGVSDEQFGRSMVGDALGDAFDALQDAYLDFCPRQQREANRALLAKSRELKATTEARLMQQIQALDMAALLKTSSGTPGNSAESSEPIPTGPD